MPGIGTTPVGSMAMKDVCDLQPRAAHRRPASPRVAACPNRECHHPERAGGQVDVNAIHQADPDNDRSQAE